MSQLDGNGRQIPHLKPGMDIRDVKNAKADRQTLEMWRNCRPDQFVRTRQHAGVNLFFGGPPAVPPPHAAAGIHAVDPQFPTFRALVFADLPLGRAVLSADRTTSGTSPVEATDLSFQLRANEVCEISGTLRYLADDEIVLSYTDPVGCDSAVQWDVSSALLTTFRAHIINGPNAGTWQLAFASSSVPGSVTIKQHSVLWKKPIV